MLGSGERDRNDAGDGSHGRHMGIVADFGLEVLGDGQRGNSE